VEKYGRAGRATDDNIMRRRLTKARIQTHRLVMVTLAAVPRQQWLRESATTLRYTYIACLVSKYFSHYDTDTVCLFLEQYAKLRLDTSVSIALIPAEHHRGSIRGSFFICISVQFDSGAHS
jgi:hypothetical protein